MDETIELGEKIRRFLRQVFGSRLTSHLEEELMVQRDDFGVRLREREIYIADLKQEIQRLQSKVAEYELVLIPLKTGGLFAPKREPSTFEPMVEPSSWKAEQARFYETEKNPPPEEQA